MQPESGQRWDEVYGARAVTELSWYQPRPVTSLRLLAQAASQDAAVIDVGGGASSLADALLEAGWSDVTVLDVSTEALALVRSRLQGREPFPALVVADVLAWRPDRQYGAWHDRAVFHFLVAAEDQQRYVATASAAVRTGGGLVLGTFASDGPTQCSGLPTARYDADDLAAAFGAGFVLEHSEREEHVTPHGVVQPFTWVVLRRQ